MSERPRPGRAIVQRYTIDNIDEVDRLQLSPNQLKLYNALLSYREKVQYINWLSEKAEALAVDNPNLAREIRRNRHTVANEMTTLAKYILDIPETIFNFVGGNELTAVEEQAAAHTIHIIGTLVEVQEQITIAATPTRHFTEFKGDAQEIDDYHTGDSASDPIPVVWYKSVSDYKDIKLKQADDNGDKSFSFPNGPEITYNEVTYDLTGADAGTLKKGKVFKNTKLFDDRGRQQKVRAALISKGFNHDNLDGDHIQDLGFQGKDEDDNIWPLDAKINRRPWMGWRGLYGVNYKNKNKEGKTGTIGSLIGKYFKIKDHLTPGDGAVPKEGVTPGPESGQD